VIAGKVGHFDVRSPMIGLLIKPFDFEKVSAQSVVGRVIDA
jgi:hypothetical protein